jgi:hypothetical protein
MCRSGVEESKALAGRILITKDASCMYPAQGFGLGLRQNSVACCPRSKPEANNIVCGFVAYCETGLGKPAPHNERV